MSLPRQVPTEVLRFLLAGGLAAAVNWLMRFPLSAFLSFEAAVAMAYLIGMSCGFLLYQRWVFPKSSRPLTAQIARFLAVNAFSAVIVLAVAVMLAGMLAGAGLNRSLAEAVAHAIAIAVGAITNYFGHKLITFAVPAVN